MKNLAAALVLTTLLASPAFADDTPALSENAQGLKNAAMKGDAQSAYNLAFCYHEGKDCPQSDTDTVKWLTFAAQKGLPDAIVNLGQFYHQGIAVPKDDGQALMWFRTAAAHGSPEGEYNIGIFYANGYGVKADPDQAAQWYERAANQGLIDAIMDVARLYMTQNKFDKAYFWFAIAAKNGEDKAVGFRDRIGKTLTAAQVNDAQVKVKAWHPKQEAEGYDQTRGGRAK